MYCPFSSVLFRAPMYSRPKLSTMSTTTFFFIVAVVSIVATVCMGLYTASSSAGLLKYSGTMKTSLPMVLYRAKGVFSTNAASVGRAIYCLAFEMVMGRTAVVKPPRIPATVSGAASSSEQVVAMA